MLRAILDATQLSLGVCWLRTPDDLSRHGEFRNYLRDPRWRRYDAYLYDRLRRLLAPGARRSVHNAEAWELLPSTTYYDATLNDGLRDRRGYFEGAWRHLRRAAIVFLDPDNGLEVPSVRCGARRSSRYVYWSEVCETYARGHSLIVYQYFPHTARLPFMADTACACRRRLVDARVMTFRAGNVAFFVIVRPDHATRFRGVESLVRARWTPQIS